MSSNKLMKKGMKDLMNKTGKGNKPGSGVKPKGLDLSMFDKLKKEDGKAAGGMMKKKGYKMGGMTKKGYQKGGMAKKSKESPKKNNLMQAINEVNKTQASKPKPKTDRQLMQMKGGGMAKKGMAKGGMTKKGYAMGGAMKKKGMKKGGKVRGVGMASKGFRPAKMVTMKGS
jgi:hypothetical protein